MVHRKSFQLESLFGFAMLTLIGTGILSPDLVHAGPPLVCHPIRIGTARSLPGGGGPFGIDQNYNRDRLVEETLALLTPDMPIIVRMETLRRATLYASSVLKGAHNGSSYSEQDQRIALELLNRLMARALESEARGRGSALAWFDAGYLIACYQQAGLAKELSGYDYVKRALSLRGEDPEIEFACALIALWPKRSEYQEHLRKAKAGAQEKSLLAANLKVHFPKG